MNNIVDFKRPERQPANGPKPPSQPFINLPPVTKYLLILLVGIHAVLFLGFDEATRSEIFLTFGFVPYVWSDANLFGMSQWSYLSPITYMGLHGNWLHLIMNTTMLMAFGTGVEKWFGAKRYIAFFILCGLIAILPEFIIEPTLQFPLIGASGALSGLFAAILLILQHTGRLPVGKYGIWPFAIIWIGISVFFGFFGPELAGAPIAWVAHLGGFFGGYLLTKTPWFKI